MPAKPRYVRPANKTPLSKSAKVELLNAYAEHYQQVATSNPAALNAKVPRDAFAEMLDGIGGLLLAHAAGLATSEGPVRDFLDANPLPAAMAPLLPDDFRTYCLVLNALKQWIAKEQAATDRYLLGGVSRQMCREAFTICLVTDAPLGADAELHHPVRDGRPPILLSKAGHDQVEGQEAFDGGDDVGKALIALRRKSNLSWAHLRRGCLDLLGEPTPGKSKAMAASARSFAKKAAEVTNRAPGELLAWLDLNELGAPSV